MVEIVVPENELERAPGLAEQLISFMRDDGGEQFLALDFNTIFHSDRPDNERGVLNLFNAVNYNNFEVVQFALNQENPDIQNHMMALIAQIILRNPDFPERLISVIPDFNDRLMALNEGNAEIVQESEEVFINQLQITHPDMAENLYNEYSGYFEQNQEFLMRELEDMQDGYALRGVTLEAMRQMFVYDNFRFVREAIERNDPATDQIILNAINLLDESYPEFRLQMSEASPEFNRFLIDMISVAPSVMSVVPDIFGNEDDVPTDVGISVVPSQTFVPNIDTPQMPASPDFSDAFSGAADIVDPEATADPPPPPPPGASVLEGLIRPQVSLRSTLGFSQAMPMVETIQERLQNLPEDPQARQAELLDISNDLQEIAIALEPRFAGDPRLHSAPSVVSNAENYEASLLTLNQSVNGALIQEEHARLVDMLIRSSQDAEVAARALDYALRPEPEVDAVATIVDRPEYTAEALSGPRDDGNAATYGIPADIIASEVEAGEGANVSPMPNYANIVTPDSRDPSNASTYGISESAIAQPGDVDREIVINDADISGTVEDEPNVLDGRDPVELNPGLAISPDQPVTPETHLGTDPVGEDVYIPQNGDILAQLGAFSSIEGAQNHWQSLLEQGVVNDNLSMIIQNVETSDGREFFRLRTGPFEDFAAAREFCDNLIQNGHECIPLALNNFDPDSIVQSTRHATVEAPLNVIRTAPVLDEAGDRDVPRTIGAMIAENTQSITTTRLSEFLDGKGFHNDGDGYTDYQALQDVFARTRELEISSAHIDAIMAHVDQENYIVKIGPAIEAVAAYNATFESNGELAALQAFFNALELDDFVPDELNSIDDDSSYDQAERDAVRAETLRIESTFDR